MLLLYKQGRHHHSSWETKRRIFPMFTRRIWFSVHVADTSAKEYKTVVINESE